MSHGPSLGLSVHMCPEAPPVLGWAIWNLRRVWEERGPKAWGLPHSVPSCPLTSLVGNKRTEG